MMPEFDPWWLAGATLATGALWICFYLLLRWTL